MKSLIIYIACYLFFVNIDISEVRQLYKDADLSEQNATNLFRKLESITLSDDKVLLAYKGAVTSMTAKYEKGIKQKKDVFKNGVCPWLSWLLHLKKKILK